MQLFFTLLITFLGTSIWAQDLAKARFRLNPYGKTPLSGIIKLDKTNTQVITVRVKGKTDDMDIAHRYPIGWGTEFPVHGFYMNYTNTVQVEMGGRRGSFTVPTGVLPERLSFRIETTIDQYPSPDAFNHDLYYISVPLQGAIIAHDKKGDLRYVQTNNIFGATRIIPTPKGMMMPVSLNPSIAALSNFSPNGPMVLPSSIKNSPYVHLDMLGKTLFYFDKEETNPDSIVINGNIIILSQTKWGWADSITEIDTNGNIITRKLLGDALRKATGNSDDLKDFVYDDYNIYQRNGTNARYDWAHFNGLTYDKKSDTLYISVRNLGLFALKYSTWDLLWWAGADNFKIITGSGFGQLPEGHKYITDVPSLQKFRLQAASDVNPRGQHAPILKKNGNIVLFDNRADEVTNSEGSRMVEYNITNRTLNLVRSFIHPKKLYSRVTSDIDLTGANRENWMILWSESYPNYLVEVSPDNSIIYETIYHTKQLFWRAEKKPLYPYMDINKLYSVDQNENEE